MPNLRLLPVRPVVALVVSTLATGCFGRRAASTTSPTRAASYGPVTVVAENRGTYEAVVYAVRGSFRQRVGSVPSLTTVRLPVPVSFTREPGPFSLLVVQIGGSARYATDSFVGQPDLLVRLTLAPRLTASTFALQ
jgi:hypothetical protein